MDSTSNGIDPQLPLVIGLVFAGITAVGGIVFGIAKLWAYIHYRRWELRLKERELDLAEGRAAPAVLSVPATELVQSERSEPEQAAEHEPAIEDDAGQNEELAEAEPNLTLRELAREIPEWKLRDIGKAANFISDLTYVPLLFLFGITTLFVVAAIILEIVRR